MLAVIAPSELSVPSRGYYLGHPQGAEHRADSNQRNGSSGKTVQTDDGPLRLDIPRDRDGSFAPILIPINERRFTGFDDKNIAYPQPVTG